MQNHCTHNTSISSLIAIAHPDEATEVIKSGGRSDRNTNVRDTSITYPSRAAADYIRFHIISISSQRRIPMVVHSISLGIPTRHQVAAPVLAARDPKAIAVASPPASPPSCPASEVLSSAGYHRSSSDFIFIKKNYYFKKTHLATRWRNQLDDETFQPSTLRP